MNICGCKLQLKLKGRFRKLQVQVKLRDSSSVSSRHYFVSSPFLPSNPGEQFYMFTIISAWLINTAGRPFTEPQEHDEPNATVSAILAELRALVSEPTPDQPECCSLVEVRGRSGG